MSMERMYRTATRKGGQNIYGEWTPDKEIVEREVALMLVNEPKTTSWLESQPKGFVLRQGNANASPSQDMLNRIEALEQRVQRQSELLEQMERALDELTGVSRPSQDPTQPIHQLHQQIINEHPLEDGQRFQAIDRDGTVWRFSSEPYIGMSTSNWWNNGGAVWCITDDVQLNGINWRDTLIKL